MDFQDRMRENINLIIKKIGLKRCKILQKPTVNRSCPKIQFVIPLLKEL